MRCFLIGQKLKETEVDLKSLPESCVLIFDTADKEVGRLEACLEPAYPLPSPGPDSVMISPVPISICATYRHSHSSISAFQLLQVK